VLCVDALSPSSEPCLGPSFHEGGNLFLLVEPCT
jgi:hypothetical protein